MIVLFSASEEMNVPNTKNAASMISQEVQRAVINWESRSRTTLTSIRTEMTKIDRTLFSVMPLSLILIIRMRCVVTPNIRPGYNVAFFRYREVLHRF